ncbi:MAG: glycosyltransferase family 39 protein [Phycisphaerales bacterium]|nr:glycosyltransferase family 39 protein [Phycisphaerales bacterium]
MRNALGDMDARRTFFLRHARGPLGGLALVLLCCTVYLPGFFSIPPVDRDESRFAQASRQMFESVALPETQRDPVLHSGGLAVPMLAGKARLNKPPLIYWLQAASAAACTGGDPLEDAIWMYRIPSLLAGIVTILATWRIGVSMFDPRAAWLGAALLAVAPVFVWEAHQARADMVMVACTTLATGQLWKIWHARGQVSGRTGSLPTPSLRLSVSSSLCLWLPTTLGILTKGPITPMVLLLTWPVAFVLRPQLPLAPRDTPAPGCGDHRRRRRPLGLRRGAARGLLALLVDRLRRGDRSRGKRQGRALGTSRLPHRAPGRPLLARLAPHRHRDRSRLPKRLQPQSEPRA